MPAMVMLPLHGLKTKNLYELHKQSRRSSYSVGDLYVGTVRKLVPGLNSAFVNVGHKKDGFLHYLDLGPQYLSQAKYVSSVRRKKWSGAMLKGFHMEEDIDKNGKITDILKENQQVLVQVAKEPISTKGPRITSEITLARQIYRSCAFFRTYIRISEN